MIPQKSSSPAIDSRCNLALECFNDPLSEAQIAAKTQADMEYKRFMKKFSECLVKRNAELVEKGNQITVYEMECVPS
jgi:hypothetical protein